MGKNALGGPSSDLSFIHATCSPVFQQLFQACTDGKLEEVKAILGQSQDGGAALLKKTDGIVSWQSVSS